MYKVKTMEWNLEGEELEKAKYIQEYIERLKKIQGANQLIDQGELAAFNYFKMAFYHEVAARIGISLISMGTTPAPEVGTNCYPHLDLSRDGRKMIGYRIEREES